MVREAGGRALHEQAVTEYSAHRRQRADVRASYGPAEPVVYYDVVVAHPFTSGAPQGPVGELLGVDPKADAALKPAEGRKRTEYKPPTDDSGVPLVPAVKVVALAFDTFGLVGQGRGG